ncbi:hypothetical protein IWW57_001746 [Coemansia sp. S610]|nr:hypothetical protein LPJ60_004565 [Coemansia sp. RSA 2675]KAJ2029365.1 hypothetical protein IWW57_001746 [Coemansia sp. S610]KAJ2416766.1 hypothetical protein GGI10_000713 [Coemansia sp. RSA 2530]
MKVVVTGASGLLGRQVVLEAERRGHTAIGTALSRAQPPKLVRLDLTDATAVERFLASERPQAIIHCAAEKRPDVAEKNQSATEQLNAVVPGRLAKIAGDLGAFFVYVSTDYVFDGTKPPYEVGDSPNPLNFYGRTKLAGERAVLEANPEAAVLRVPVLYGPAEHAAESAVNVLVDVVQKGAAAQMDAWQARFPTCTVDVARVLVDLSEISVGAVGEGVAGIFHFSASERMTKYDMCRVFARLLGLEGHLRSLVPVTEKPDSEQVAASRPDNTQLSTEALEEIGVSVACVSFEKWWSDYLSSK